MKKIAVLIAAVALVFVAAPAEAATSTYTNKQKNRYWSLVKARSSDAVVFGKKETIKFGTLTCDLLRSGGTLYDLADIMTSNDDYVLIEDFLVAAMAAAPIVLCPDQQYKFE